MIEALLTGSISKSSPAAHFALILKPIFLFSEEYACLNAAPRVLSVPLINSIVVPG